MRRYYPAPLLYALVGLLVLANVINIGADLGAMGAALQLILPGPQWLYVAAFAILIVLLEVFMRYASYVSVLRWLTLSLFAYVATVFVVGVPWGTVAFHLVVPACRVDGGLFHHRRRHLRHDDQPLSLLLAGFRRGRRRGGRSRRRAAPEGAGAGAARSSSASSSTRMVGMGVSNLVALFIVLTTAATLHAHGVTNVETSADAAKALKPIAGELAFAVFALGIVGTGLLAVPVLAGSAAYALGETLGWRIGLAERAGSGAGLLSGDCGGDARRGAAQFLARSIRSRR